jgi:hypothetical protein
LPRTVAPERDPVKARAGRAGMLKRWGPPRIIRLDDLPPEQRAFIAELVEIYRRNEAPAARGGQ